jgi:hypothetical protein
MATMTTMSAPKKIPYHHHHVMRHKPQSIPTPEPSLLDQDIVDDLLLRAIHSICEEAAVKEGLDDAGVEAPAAEALLEAANECTCPLLHSLILS